MKRRRNRLVLWEWSPDGSDRAPRRDNRPRSVARDAVLATVLLGTIVFALSRIPPAADGSYGRSRLPEYMCELAGTEPQSLTCVGLTMGGWLAIVVTLGVLLKLGRGLLRAIRGDNGR